MNSLRNNMGPIVSDNSVLRSLGHSSNRLNIGHINCRSLNPTYRSAKIDELRSILDGGFLDVFGVTETWLHDSILDRAVEISGYNLCRNDRSTLAGGVGIYISRKFRYKIVQRICRYGECESIFVEITCGIDTLLLGVVYLPDDNPRYVAIFEDSAGDILTRYENIVLMGDFNENLFNSSKSLLMRSLCNRFSLNIIHNSMPTHYDVSWNSTSLIDYFVLSDLSKFVSSGQMQCPGISDHALIFVCLEFNAERSIDTFSIKDYSKTDYNRILTHVSLFDSSRIFSTNNVDDQLLVINSLIDNLFDCVPTKTYIRRYGCENWMRSEVIINAKYLRDLAYRAYLDNPSDDNWRIYTKYRNRTKTVIRWEKKKHDMRNFENIDNSEMWRRLRNAGCVGRNEVNLEVVDVDLINQSFISDHGTSNIFSFDFGGISDEHTFSFDNITEEEFVNSLFRIKSNSIGVDGFPIKLIRMVYPYISLFLLHFVNTIFTTSTFPRGWKVGRIVPIPKCGDGYDVENLRPISIMPAISKVVENIMKLRIMQHVNRFSLIKDCQYAYRSGHNTTSLLLGLTDTVRKCLNDSKLCFLLSLDLSKAFDRVDHLRLLEKLRDKFKFSKTACSLVASYLTGRSQFVSLNGRSSFVGSIGSGVPQGSVLGPLLFMLYMNDFVDIIDCSYCKPFVFADDIQLVFSCHNDFMDVLKSIASFTLSNIESWMRANSFLVNTSKTKALSFGSRSENISELDIRLYGRKIDFVGSLKCLGITLDDQLSFNTHINVVNSRICFTLRRLYSLNLNLPLRIKSRVAYALLMSIINYGLEVYTGTSNGNLERIRLIVNRVARYVYNLPRREHISPRVFEFLGCSFKTYVSYKLLSLFYNIVKRQMPAYLIQMIPFSNSTRNKQISISRISSTSYEQSFHVRLSRVFNSLPSRLREFKLSKRKYNASILEYLNSI